MKISPLAAAALTILAASTPVSPAATTSERKTIVGGTNANANEFPYFVQGKGCGASLIWYDMVLTSARCEGFPWYGEVYIGNLIRNQVTAGALSRNVAQQVKHPNWNPFTLENDFLLLKLSAEVPRNHSVIKLIKLIELNNAPCSPADNDTLTTLGFGYATNLQKATLYSGSQTMCASGPFGSWYSSASMLCAFAPTRSACSGDVGGPLMDARGVQVGVISWMDSDSCKGTTYFARVSAAYSWIRTQICLLASNPPTYCPRVGLTNSTMVEGDSTTITFTSEGLGFPTSGSVDWGDGSVDSVTKTSFTHKYLNGDANYTIKTTFRHSALPISKQDREFSVFVKDAAPSVVLGIPSVVANSWITSKFTATTYTANVTVKCCDAGVLDNQTVYVNWNDSSAEDSRDVPSPTPTANCNNVTFSHKYTKPGNYTIGAYAISTQSLSYSKIAQYTLTVSGRRRLLRGVDDKDE